MCCRDCRYFIDGPGDQDGYGMTGMEPFWECNCPDNWCEYTYSDQDPDVPNNCPYFES